MVFGSIVSGIANWARSGGGQDEGAATMAEGDAAAVAGATGVPSVSKTFVLCLRTVLYCTVPSFAMGGAFLGMQCRR